MIRVDSEIDYLNSLNLLPDVILSDWVLTNFSGLRALQILIEKKVGTPFIVYSGRLGEETAIEALHRGAFDYVIKDRPEKLGEVIRNALQKKILIEEHNRNEEIFALQTAALNATANPIVITDNIGTIEWVNPAFTTMTGYSTVESIGKNPRDLLKSGQVKPKVYKQMWDTIIGGGVWRGELINRKKDGQLYYETQTITPVKNSAGLISHFISIKEDITGSKNAEDTFNKLSHVVEQTTEIVLITDPEGIIEYVNPAFEIITGYSKGEVLGKSPQLIKSDVHNPEDYKDLWKTILAGKIYNGILVNRKKNGDLFYQDTIISPLRDEGGNTTHFVSTGIDITEKIRGEAESKNRYAELEAVNQISTALRSAQTLYEMLPLLLDETLKVLGETLGDIRLYDPMKDELMVAVSRGYADESDGVTLPKEKAGEGISGYVVQTGKTYISEEFRTDLHLAESMRKQIPPGVGGVTVPIRAANNIIGTITISVRSPRIITESKVKLLTTMSEIAGNAIHRTSLQQQTVRQLDQLSALRDIDQIILSSFDLELNLGIILQHVIMQIGVDAANILIFNPVSQTLEYAAGRGFNTTAIKRTKLRLGESHAGKAAMERTVIHIPNLSEASTPLLKIILDGEKFVSYYAIPLIAKGQIKGVLEIFHREELELDEELLYFLNSLAGQTAIAIDISSLFLDLERSNLDLSQAYDATIEGWSKALDLRDQETEGHTQRVTEMTVNLATNFGFNGDNLTQVRWGALLHDIGKMGVPDGILLKPGPLTAEEWVIMKKHTTYAFEMLSPINYLRSAIDIPYCHHEKWDGSGYPRGLQGEHIPLSARIFAVVDVWDALSSDRPYRLAWPKEKIFEYLQSLSGIQFDPEVLDTILKTGLLGN